AQLGKALARRGKVSGTLDRERIDPDSRLGAALGLDNFGALFRFGAEHFERGDQFGAARGGLLGLRLLRFGARKLKCGLSHRKFAPRTKKFEAARAKAVP